jgi:alpha-N-arabinofuranosidase
MILTQGEKMLLTPTYHVFEMYTVHHDAILLPVELQCADYSFEQQKIPSLSVSASKGKDGKIHLSLCNLNPNASAELVCELRGAKAAGLAGRVLTADTMQAHSTFEEPIAVTPAQFTAFKVTNNGFSASIPARSVVVLDVQ